MRVPAVNFQPILDEVGESWRRYLDQLLTRQNFILGEQVKSFEESFAAALGAKHCIGVGNGTDAIQLCLRELEITKRSQQVLTTALTAPFSGIGILAAGASPRFADINPATLQIDPDDAGNRITKHTAAIMPVHLYGQPCDIRRLAKLAREKKIALVQDACQAHGTFANGKPLTTYSWHVAYSFYPTKNLGCLGDGGAIVTNSSEVANRLRQLRDGGRKGGQVTFLPGINSRLDEMHACFLRACLPHLEQWNEHRRKIASLYDEGLKDVDGVRLVERTEDSVCHLYGVRAARRDKLRSHLAAKGIGTGIHYPVPMHLHPTYNDCRLKRGDLPNAERACREVLSLPLWPHLSVESADEVITRVREFYRAN